MSNAGTTIFILFAVIALFAAAFTVTAKSAIRAAVGLLAHIISLAALYLTLHAHLLATLQLIVYAGAVVVLFIFVIMLIGPVSEDKGTDRGLVSRALGAGAMAIVTAAIAFNIWSFAPDAPAITSCPGGANAERWTTNEQGVASVTCGEFGGVRSFGLELYREAGLPFELISILLLVAIIGAIAIGRGRSNEEVEALKARKAARLASPVVAPEPVVETESQPVGGE
ncbi:MAG: NADH-quinone oxidoreductase subunit J [Sandaracinaceae bacterium]|nr:NADH-quinone oxidoreductase subunit J [Sandaracinaceae bacterium]